MKAHFKALAEAFKDPYFYMIAALGVPIYGLIFALFLWVGYFNA